MKNLNNLVYLIKYATAANETPATTPEQTTPAAGTEQSIYDQAINWIKENPWTAGAGALGLGGLGYYLLSDDDEEDEEE